MRLSEINSPGELTVDPDLIDRFTQAGWQIDGEGQDQLVMSKPGSNIVLKIVGAGSQPRQAQIRRYVEFFRANQRDPHFPRVGADRELAWKGRKYYAYTQERLRPLSGDEAVMDYLEYAMAELGHDQEPDFERIPPGLSVEQIEGLIGSVDHMFQAGLGGQYGFDLANMANIMQRGDGQLVIVDPFSGFDDELNEGRLQESQYVYRVDSQRIPDFGRDMQTYYHTADFSRSGQFPKGAEIPKEYTGKMQGVYAGTKLFTALYATGNANQTRYVAKYSPGQPTVYFDKRDVPRLKTNRSYLTVFDGRRFKKLPTGEWFSSDPGQFVEQQAINNPFDYISRAGWKIQQVDDLPAVLEKLKAAGARYGAEGMAMDEALVHRGQVRSQDPNDVWHVRDDATRKLRHHRGGVVLAQARPQIYQDDAKASYTYTTDARGRRRRSLPSFHWAYIQGRMVKGLPQDISQGRKLWFKRGQGFVYADSQEPFAAADYVAFNPDGSVVAYDSGQPAAAAGPVVSVEPAQQTVAEARQPVLNILRQALPDWPDYVLKDWLGTRVKDQEDLKNLRGWIDEIKKTVQPNSWRLHQKMPITFDMLDPKTRYFMKTKRQFGDRNPFMIPRDRERLEDAMRLVQEKGIENLPPVIMLQGPKGLELTEGWHRTMAAFRQHPDGFRINAWIGQRSQQVNEVQILAKVKGKGSEPGQIPKYGRPIQPDQEVRYLGQQVGKVGRYQLWRDWLGGQLSYHVFDPESRTVVLTTFGSRYHRNPNSYIIHGLYAAPGNPVKAHQFYRNLIQDQGLTLISDRKQSPGGNRVWQRLEAYPDIEVYGFDTKTGEVMNFGAADAEMYAVPPQAAKDRESRYIAKNIRLVATAR